MLNLRGREPLNFIEYTSNARRQKMEWNDNFTWTEDGTTLEEQNVTTES